MLNETSRERISVIIPVGRRQADAAILYAEYKAGLDTVGLPYEMIFVLDGPQPRFSQSLRDLIGNGAECTVVSLTRRFGEATAIMAGFEHASGEIIVTLPAYQQIDPTELTRLIDATGMHDLAIGMRWPRAGGALEKMRRATFHRLLKFASPFEFHDLGCGARAFNRKILEEVHLYGDQHRFLALLADRQGFKVKEVPVRQSPKDRHTERYEVRDYLRALLDILSIFFLVRFTKKPLRFFGMVGAATFAVGGLLVAWLVIERIFLGHGLSERPALLLSSLLVVLGLQLFALGLLGELVIFTHAKQIRDYQIDSVVRHLPPAAKPGAATPAPEPSSFSTG